MAVGALVAAEIALGIMLFIRGTADVEPVNPWRVGDGFPEPPDCSIASDAQLERMLGDHGTTSTYRRENLGPVRVCVYKTSSPVKEESKHVELTMQSKIDHVAGWQVPPPGPPEFELYDNMSKAEGKRYFDEGQVRFKVDNLEVMIRFQGYAGFGNPPPADRGRFFRDESKALATEIRAKLLVRNKTTAPTPSR